MQTTREKRERRKADNLHKKYVISQAHNFRQFFLFRFGSTGCNAWVVMCVCMCENLTVRESFGKYLRTN